MTSSELDDLVDSEKLKLDPNKFESDEELADAICEELDIKKPGGRRRVVEDEPAKEPEGRSRLASMREKRERGDR